MTEEARKEFEEAAKPLIKFLAENFHPHVKCVVDATTAEVLEGLILTKTEEFLRD